MNSSSSRRLISCIFCSIFDTDLMIIQFIYVLLYWIGDQIYSYFQDNHTLSYQYIFLFILSFIIGNLKIYHPCDGLFSSYYEINRFFFSYVAELSASNKYSGLLVFFVCFRCKTMKTICSHNLFHLQLFGSRQLQTAHR